MTLQDLLKLKEEDYDAFLNYTKSVNEPIDPRKLKDGYVNRIAGGLSSKGRTVSNEEKKLKSEKMKGKNAGRIPDEETRKKMSESHMGIVSPNKGKSLSVETKAKISKAHSKPYAIYKGVTYTAIALAEKLGFKHVTKVSFIKSGRKKDEWGITFL
jgi:hypothetical protein